MKYVSKYITETNVKINKNKTNKFVVIRNFENIIMYSLIFRKIIENFAISAILISLELNYTTLTRILSSRFTRPPAKKKFINRQFLL